MKLKSIIAVIVVLAVAGTAVMLFTGCGKSPETTPDTTSAENTEAQQITLFTKGVWVGIIDGEKNTYFLFNDEKSGRTEKADGTGGVPFTCEQNGLDVVFHFGSVDDVTNAKFDLGNNTGTFDYGEEKITYEIAYVDGADPETFEVPTPEEQAETERRMIINSEPYVITAKDGFDNFGVTELICDATETYNFTASDENTTWKVFVLDEKFADGARYLPQAEEPTLEGNGTLKIEEGKYIYILCSESAFNSDTASEASLSIDYAA